MKVRDEISQRLIEAAHSFPPEEMGTAEFKNLFGSLLHDETAALALRKFEAAEGGNAKPLTLEDAEERIHLLLGKEFGK